MALPQVTVLIAAQNAAATRPKRLDSLVAQVYRDFEVLSVNDASHDNIVEIACIHANRTAVRSLDLPMRLTQYRQHEQQVAKCGAGHVRNCP